MFKALFKSSILHIFLMNSKDGALQTSLARVVATIKAFSSSARGSRARGLMFCHHFAARGYISRTCIKLGIYGLKARNVTTPLLGFAKRMLEGLLGQKCSLSTRCCFTLYNTSLCLYHRNQDTLFARLARKPLAFSKTRKQSYA